MEFDVGLDKQHLESLGATAPMTGIIELVWNALDADANEVKVELIRNDLDGVEEIRVVDDGHGIRADELEMAFGMLGDDPIHPSARIGVAIAWLARGCGD
jgi:hypothetical protein